jgi:hypothetical protein
MVTWLHASGPVVQQSIVADEVCVWGAAASQRHEEFVTFLNSPTGGNVTC